MTNTRDLGDQCRDLIIQHKKMVDIISRNQKKENEFINSCCHEQGYLTRVIEFLVNRMMYEFSVRTSCMYLVKFRDLHILKDEQDVEVRYSLFSDALECHISFERTDDTHSVTIVTTTLTGKIAKEPIPFTAIRHLVEILLYDTIYHPTEVFEIPIDFSVSPPTMKNKFIPIELFIDDCRYECDDNHLIDSDIIEMVLNKTMY